MKGGKRTGAGRKPCTDKKQSFAKTKKTNGYQKNIYTYLLKKKKKKNN